MVLESQRQVDDAAGVVLRMLHHLDENNDGHISYDEFMVRTSVLRAKCRSFSRLIMVWCGVLFSVLVQRNATRSHYIMDSLCALFGVRAGLEQFLHTSAMQRRHGSGHGASTQGGTHHPRRRATHASSRAPTGTERADGAGHDLTSAGALHAAQATVTPHADDTLGAVSAMYDQPAAAPHVRELHATHLAASVAGEAGSSSRDVVSDQPRGVKVERQGVGAGAPTAVAAPEAVTGVESGGGDMGEGAGPGTGAGAGASEGQYGVEREASEADTVPPWMRTTDARARVLDVALAQQLQSLVEGVSKAPTTTKRRRGRTTRKRRGRKGKGAAKRPGRKARASHAVAGVASTATAQAPPPQPQHQHQHQQQHQQHHPPAHVPAHAAGPVSHPQPSRDTARGGQAVGGSHHSSGNGGGTGRLMQPTRPPVRVRVSDSQHQGVAGHGRHLVAGTAGASGAGGVPQAEQVPAVEGGSGSGSLAQAYVVNTQRQGVQHEQCTAHARLCRVNMCRCG